MLALHLDEIRRLNDFDALVLTKLEQVLVSTHQIIRTARGRTFEDAVVSRVFFDGIYSLLWFDMLCETGNLPDCLIDLLFRPAKLVAPQNSLDFIQDRIRDGKMDSTIFGHFKDVSGIARKVQARNDDIRIGGDAQHVLSGAFGTCSRNLRVRVSRRQSTRAGITLSEFERFTPFRTAQASLNGITHQFLRCDVFFRSRLLDLFDQLARKPYVFSRHTAILLLSRENITLLTIVNAY
jgi:hypothetical protein